MIWLNFLYIYHKNDNYLYYSITYTCLNTKLFFLKERIREREREREREQERKRERERERERCSGESKYRRNSKVDWLLCYNWRKKEEKKKRGNPSHWYLNIHWEIYLITSQNGIFTCNNKTFSVLLNIYPINSVTAGRYWCSNVYYCVRCAADGLELGRDRVCAGWDCGDFYVKNEQRCCSRRN